MTDFIRQFMRIAQTYPTQVALHDRGQDVTYADLCADMQRIGSDLQRRRLPAESVIGLSFEKSADYIRALLGVWYAGLAFAPLPPSLPAARRDFIIKDAGITTILSADTLMPDKHTDILPPVNVTPDTLAYIMHTSGSTGTPKGVMVEHGGILNVLNTQIKAFGLTAQSRSLFYLSISFDASLSDIGTALLSGAMLVITDDAVLKDGAKLTHLLAAKQITHCDMPPSLLRILQPEEMPKSLQTIIIGGEAATPETVRRWASHMNVINVYGPTEATICTSLCACDAQHWDKPLLGKPFAGVDYRIIDGELYIGGCQLARGYLNMPTLTAEKFMTVDGQRLYRSGDRVRDIGNSDIAFLGRIDRQFKIRGQLVEPDEIETTLRSHPSVQKAAVVKTVPAGQLAAYVVLQGSVQTTALSAYLSARLPVWMVPQYIVPLDHLPETASGKTDLTALSLRRLASDTAAAPDTAAEKALFAVWARALKHSNFGVTQSFYEAGGDSLGVIQLTLDMNARHMAYNPADIAAGASIRSLCAAGAQMQGDAIDVDALKRAVVFDAALQARMTAASQRAAQITPHQRILLTGATGCLGSRVLATLLQETEADIYCIVRAGHDDAAADRIAATFKKHNLPYDAYAPRIHALAGDTAQAQLGLPAEVYAQLTQQIDTIYHCAATVHMLADFETLRPANTDAARYMLEFALQGVRKALHIASTLSVFVGTDQNTGIALESDRLDSVRTVYGGYAQSKFAAEWMLLQVPESAAAISHYRFGLLTGDTATGAAPERDFLALFGRGIAGLGMVPEGFADTLYVDITPVDYAARAMVHLARHAPPDTYHIANPSPLSLGDFCAALQRRKMPLRPVSVAVWQDVLHNRPMTMNESAAALGLCRVLPPDAYTQNRNMDLFQATGITFDMRHADRYLKPAGITCPPADAALMDLYMSVVFGNQKKPFKICIFGPESTGKSTLAQNLSAHYGAPLAEEYAHGHIAARGGQITLDDIPLIAAGQLAAERRAVDATDDLVICDTDLLTTTIWSDWLFRSCPDWIRETAAAQHYDLYLLMDIDTPWVEDVHRYLPEDRVNFLEVCQKTLALHGRPYVLLSGSWAQKFSAACAAIDRLRDTAQPQLRTGT